MKIKKFATVAALTAALAASPIYAGMKKSLERKLQEKYGTKGISCSYFFNDDSSAAKVVVFKECYSEFGDLKYINKYERIYRYSNNGWRLRSHEHKKTFYSVWECIKDAARTEFLRK